jgi:hypothetical protein
MIVRILDFSLTAASLTLSPAILLQVGKGVAVHQVEVLHETQILLDDDSGGADRRRLRHH